MTDPVVDPNVDPNVDPTPDPNPTPTPKPDDYDPEKALVDAQQAQRTRLEELGGKFDASGNFLGFDTTDQQTQRQVNVPPVDDPNADPMDARFASLRQDVLTVVQPAAIESALNGALAGHPELAPYKGVAEAMLKKVPPGTIVNKEYVLTTLYFARGQGADVEIVKAKNDAISKQKAEQERLAAGAVSGSDGGAGSPSPNPQTKVSALTQEMATAWGMKPEELQKKVDEDRKVAR